MTVAPNSATFNAVLAAMQTAVAHTESPQHLQHISATAMAVFREMQVRHNLIRQRV